MDRMLRIMGSGVSSETKIAGDTTMLNERVEVPAAGQVVEQELSGALVGVLPVNAAAAPVKGSAERLALLHVLVVDDDAAVRKACVQIAAGMGFAVVPGADSARRRGGF